ncbi:MAG: transcription-repair coupling factor, partial [Lachnospiraceae bacterium]|nr:transcription-repair coupling factor [Lachnospiraceae bacterium]
MRALLAPLQELGEYDEIKKMLGKDSAAVALSGCVDSEKLHMVYGLSDGFRYKIIVTFDELKAKELYEDYKFYDRNVMIYPAKDLIFFQADIHGNQLIMQRMKVLRRLMEKRPVTIITTFDALMAPQVPLSVQQQNVISINKTSSIDENSLAMQLTSLGYEKNYQVEAPGQFSIRGGIVDIFDLTEENPYRIELWGEDVESIRSFDVLSQRSIENLESVSIYPATEIALSEEELRAGIKAIEKEGKEYEGKLRSEMKTEEAHRIHKQIEELKEQLLELGFSFNAVNLESYIRYFYPELSTFLEFFPREQSCIFVDEPIRVSEYAGAVEFEFRESMMHRVEKGYILPGQMDVLFRSEEVAAKIADRRVVALSMMDGKNPLFKTERKFDVQARSLPSYNNSFDALVKDLLRYKNNGYRVLLLSGSRTRAKRLAE